MDNEAVDCRSLASLECNIKDECLPFIQFLLPTEENIETVEELEESKAPIEEYCMKENFSFQESNLLYNNEKSIRSEKTRNWTELYRKLDHTIAEIFDEVATLVESGIDLGHQEFKPGNTNNSIYRGAQKYADENYTSKDIKYPQELGSTGTLVYDEIQRETAADPLAFTSKSTRKSWKKIGSNDQDERYLGMSQKKIYSGVPKLYKCVFPGCTYSSKFKSNVNKHGKIHYKTKLNKITKVIMSKTQKLPNSGKENEGRIDSFFPFDARTNPILPIPENSDAEALDNEASDLCLDVSSASQKSSIESGTEEYFKRRKSTSNTYRCSNCNYVTAFKFNLNRHSVIHSSGHSARVRKQNSKSLPQECVSTTSFKNGVTSKLFMCSQCSYESSSRQCISRHERADHSDASEKQKFMSSAMINCFECDFLTPYKNNLWHHETRHKNFNQKNTIIKNRSMVKKLKLKTIEAKRKFKNNKSVREEAAIIHARDNPKEINIKTSAVNKIGSRRGKAGGLPFQQDLKGKAKVLKDDEVLSSKDRNLGTGTGKLKSRMGNDIIPVKMFKCVECQFASRRRSLVTKHQMNHPKSECLTISDSLRFKCPSCTFTSDYKFCVERHVKSHPSPKENVFKCSLCSYSSKRRHNVKMHELRHEKGETYVKIHEVKLEKKGISLNVEKKYGCSQCLFNTNSQSSFSRHRYVHLKTKRFACAYCTYKTNYKSDFIKHDLKHLSK